MLSDGSLFSGYQPAFHPMITKTCVAQVSHSLQLETEQHQLISFTLITSYPEFNITISQTNIPRYQHPETH